MQAKGPVAIVDKVAILIKTDLCIFDLVPPWYTSPMVKNESETVISKNTRAEWPCVALLNLWSLQNFSLAATVSG